jgi:DNA polymerase-3 subunit delta'
MFDRLIGNNEIKSIVRRMIASGRMPRSLLFAGPEGSGKREFALEIARAFVCVSKVGDEGCGHCSACVRAAKYTFPEADAKKDNFEHVFLSEHTDVGTVIPCRNNILVESVRELEREANFLPYEASARFFIIDDADRMNDAASNALLKTLEEPPATSYIFLVTARPDTLLSTIRSRCQTLRFAPVPDAEVASLLMRERRLPAADADLIARISGGSVGRALAFDLERFRDQRAAMLGIVESIAGDRPDLAALLSASERLSDAKLKDEFYDRLDILQLLVRDIWTIHLGRDAVSAVNADLAPRLAALARSLRGQKIPDWMESIETLRERRVLNLNKKIATDALLVGMCAG